MRLKRKSCERIQFCLPDSVQQHFKKDYKSVKFLRDILHVSEGVQQISLIKEIESNLLQNVIVDQEEVEFVADALCIMLYQAPVKSSHRKALNRFVQEIFQKYPVIIEKCLKKFIESVTSLSDETVSIEEIETSIQFISSLMDNLKFGKNIVDQNSSRVWQYVSFVFKKVARSLKQEVSLQKKGELFSACQTIVKLITHTIQNCDTLKRLLKSNEDEKIMAASQDIKDSLQYLIASSETSLNCRLNATFAFCYYYYCSFGVELFKHDVLFKYPFSCDKFDSTSHLCILSGCMAVLPTKVFNENFDHCVLAQKILSDILDASKLSTGDSEILLLCARCILQWTSIIQNILSDTSMMNNQNEMASITCMFSKYEPIMRQLFEYVLRSSDHFIDTLRHLSKDIFHNILNLHMLAMGNEPQNSSVLKEMTLYLLKDLPSHSRAKYGMLSCIVEILGTKAILRWHSTLPDDLYKALMDCSLVSHVSEFCQVLFSSSVDCEDEKTFQSTWIIPLLEVLSKGSKEQSSAVCEHVLPKLLKVKPASLPFLLSNLSSMWENNIGSGFCAFVTCMKIYQRQKGASNHSRFLSSESLITAFFHADDQVRISAFALLCENFKTTEPIHSSSFEIIKSGLPYNVNCQSPSFRQQLISYLKKLFVRMIDSGYALMKNQLCPKNENALSKSVLPQLYQDFLLWLKNYLFSCLHPGANFPRRVTSLNLLHLLHEIFSGYLAIVDSEATLQTLLYVLQDTYENNKILALKILSSEYALTKNLKDEVLFQTALTLASSTKPPDTSTSACLFVFMVHCPSFQPVVQKHLSQLSSQTLNFALSVSTEGTHTSHYSTILMLMYKLNKQLELAKKSLLEAAAQAPLYGILTSIRAVLQDLKFNNIDNHIILWQHLIKELVTLSIHVAEVVEPVVCNSSPEGHLPMDTDIDSLTQLQAAVRRALGCRFQSAVVQENSLAESEEVVLDIVKTHAVTAQILVLCCWRTHKEVSLLLGDICEKIPLRSTDSKAGHGVLDIPQVKDIGKYFIYQMSLVKHKGAFEQAYIGFTKLCSRLWRCNVAELQEHPKLWLEDLILAIKGLKEDIQLCPTRRSAGLPFIVQGLLTSEPTVICSSFFKQTMQNFLDLADPLKSHDCDIQIHALNILRALFRDACLGEAVLPFVCDGLKISILGFKSHHWGVRNSSTLLYSALMTRIFGVNRSQDEAGKKNKMTGKSFFSYYNIYNFLYKEVEDCVPLLFKEKANKISIQPTLYPIFLLLGRLYPAPGEKDEHLSSFLPYLQLCAGSPIWKVRTLAAKAFIAFTPYEKISKVLCQIIDLLPSMKNADLQKGFLQNRVHGCLLQIKYLLGEFSYLSNAQKVSVRETLQNWFSSCFDLYVKFNQCLSTKAAFLEIFLCSLNLKFETEIAHIKTLMEDLWLNLEPQDQFFVPDHDSYITVSVAIVFLYFSVLRENNKCQILHPKTNFNLTFNMLIMEFMQSPNKLVRCASIEMLLWLFQDSSEIYTYCVDSCEDIVVLEKIIKTINTLDKNEYQVKDILEDQNINVCLIELLKKEDDPSFLRQIYKLMCFMPNSVSVPWPFLQDSHSVDLITKLKYVLSEMENHNRDEVICQMLLYSAHIFVNVIELFERRYEDKSLHEAEGLEVIEKWLEKLEESSYPENSVLLRQTVISILEILVKESLFPKSKLFGSFSSYLWQCLLLVLIDDEPEIKYMASEIVVKIKLASEQGSNIMSVVPSKAVELMIEAFIRDNFKNTSYCVSMLNKWMLSSNTDPLNSMNDEQPFDKGEMNVFSEDLSLTDIVSKQLSLYLESQKLLKGNTILSQKITVWKDKNVSELMFEEVISSCLSEANAVIDCFLSRTAICPMLDTYIDLELLQISQRLSVVLVLLSWSQYQSNFRILADELLSKFETFNFRTFFIKDIISKLHKLIDQLQN